MSFYSGRRVLVTGGTGTVGTPVVRRLLSQGAQVTVASIDPPERVRAVLLDGARFEYADLRDFETCLRITRKVDFLFHFMGVKGSTQIETSRAATGFVSFMLCNTNTMEAAFRNRVERFLFVGSINEYPPLPLRHEDDLWKGAPEAADRYNGIAKRAGEAQAECYVHEHGWDAVRIVRLSNVYGACDDFDPRTSHVIPALIHKMIKVEGGEVIVAGDGSAIRDFVYTEDIAEGCLLALAEAPPCMPINLGSGQGVSIKELAHEIADAVPIRPTVRFDSSKPRGDAVRILDIQRAKKLLNWEPKTALQDGLRQTVAWYLENREVADRRGRELHG